MINYILKRLLLMMVTLFGILCVTFAVVHLAPGDPVSARMQAGEDGASADAASRKIADETRALYGLDKPLHVQFGRWIGNTLTLNFGNSYRDHRPAIKKIAEALPITLTLNVITILVIYAISIPLGVATAARPKGLLDRITTFVFFALYSLPSFWVAMILIVLFAGGDYLNAFPVTGFISRGASLLPWYDVIGNVTWHLVLPIVCLTYGGFAFLTRFTRSAVLEVIRQDYIRTARAKGLSEWRVIIHHGLRNALVPLVSLMSTLLPSLIGGSVIVERIFSIPGMGRLGFESVLARDYPVVMAIATISAALTLVSILISDVLYMAVDPRIKTG